MNEKIDQGNSGVVYKINIKNKDYALKREKIINNKLNKLFKLLSHNKKNMLNILLDNSTDNLFGVICREIYFNIFINKINKNHFLILYKYKINKCNNIEHQLTDSIKNIQGDLLKYNQGLTYKYCLDYIYDLKDGCLLTKIYKLDKKQIYSLIIQIVYALYLMHSNNFYHRDIHIKNICFVKTSQKYINIFDYKINTFGYIFSIIDYRRILNDDFKLNDSEKKEIIETDLKYQDNLNFLTKCIYNHNTIMINLISKIINKIKLSKNEKNSFDKKILNYRDVKYYIKNIKNSLKIIIYFNNKLNLLL